MHAAPRQLGVTLIELLVGLAITTLMTIAGWRAIDAMQVARDTTVADAARWQSIDTLFATIEADLRRADLQSFSGNAQGFTFKLNPLTTTEGPQAIAYGFVAAQSGVVQVLRQTDADAVTLVEVSSGVFAYRTASKPATSSAAAAPSGRVERIDEFPRAIDIGLDLLGRDANETTPRRVARTVMLR